MENKSFTGIITNEQIPICEPKYHDEYILQLSRTGAYLFQKQHDSKYKKMYITYYTFTDRTKGTKICVRNNDYYYL